MASRPEDSGRGGVALAAWGMAKGLIPDRPRITVAVLAAAAILAWQSAVGQIVVIAVGGADRVGPLQAIGRVCRRPQADLLRPPHSRGVASSLSGAAHRGADCIHRRCQRTTGGLRQLLSVGVSGVRRRPRGAATASTRGRAAGMGDQRPVRGWLRSGTGRARAALLLRRIPGDDSQWYASGWYGGLYALAAIYVPSFLLVTGALPFWDQLRRKEDFRGALKGINAVVVGLIVAALYDPVWTSAILRPAGLCLGAGRLWASGLSGSGPRGWWWCWLGS